MCIAGLGLRADMRGLQYLCFARLVPLMRVGKKTFNRTLGRNLAWQELNNGIALC